LPSGENSDVDNAIANTGEKSVPGIDSDDETNARSGIIKAVDYAAGNGRNITFVDFNNSGADTISIFYSFRYSYLKKC